MTVAETPPAPEIPDVDLATFTLARAAELGDKPALIDGPTGRTISFAEFAPAGRRARRRARRSRHRQGRRGRDLHAQPPRVRGDLPGRPARERDEHDREPALHRARARPPAHRLRREDAVHDRAVPRHGAGRRRARGHRRHRRRRRGRGRRADPRRPPRRGGRAAGDRHRPGDATSRSSPTRAARPACRRA